MKHKLSENPFYKVFKFCPRCKNPFKQKEFNLFICKNCDLHLYEDPRFSNAVIFENENKEILMIKRKWPPKVGFLDLPGGFIDLGETVEESVKREIKEELGINLEDFKFLGFSEPDFYDFKGVKYQTISLVFTAKIKDQKVKALDDVGELIWLKKHKIPFEKLAFKKMEKVLKDYLKLK